MVGTRHKSAPKRQIPDWIIKESKHLKDTSDPDRAPVWFKLDKTFTDVQPARRYADAKESNNRRSKLIEVVNDRTQKPIEYRVYVRDRR